jgi:hypothetical protein
MKISCAIIQLHFMVLLAVLVASSATSFDWKGKEPSSTTLVREDSSTTSHHSWLSQPASTSHGFHQVEEELSEEFGTRFAVQYANEMAFLRESKTGNVHRHQIRDSVVLPASKTVWMKLYRWGLKDTDLLYV